MEPHERKVKSDIPPKRDIFFNNFLAGIAWGLGSVLGATVIVGLLGILVVRTQKVPIIGDVVQVIVEQVEKGAEEITPQQ